MRKSNIKLSLSLLNPVKLLALLINVIAKMTGNAHFATPAVSLATLKTLADQLTVAIEEATNGSRQSKIVRDDIVTKVKDLLRTQADYVRTVAAGDKAILESSGFELAKQPEPLGVPAAPAFLNCRMTGIVGELELRFGGVHGATGYRIMFTDKDPATNNEWTTLGFTARVTYLVTELDPYKPYWFCVSAIGYAGEGAKCDPAIGRAA